MWEMMSEALISHAGNRALFQKSNMTVLASPKWAKLGYLFSVLLQDVLEYRVLYS